MENLVIPSFAFSVDTAGVQPSTEVSAVRLSKSAHMVKSKEAKVTSGV